MNNLTLFLALIVTGGYDNNDRIGTTSIIDIANDQRTSGPDLIVPRMYHACNTVEIGSKKYAIVLGGIASNTRLASTELLDLDQLDQGSWIIGKSFTVFIYFSKNSCFFVGPNLPIALSSLTLVSTSSTSLFAIGGYSDNVEDRKKVYKFTCSGTTVDTCQWVEHQTLQNGRDRHVAIPLTDEWVTHLC